MNIITIGSTVTYRCPWNGYELKGVILAENEDWGQGFWDILPELSATRREWKTSIGKSIPDTAIHFTDITVTDNEKSKLSSWQTIPNGIHYIYKREKPLSQIQPSFNGQNNMPTYMTNKERKLLDSQFQVMLRTSHDSLLSLCNTRYPETIEGVLKENPVARDPARIVALNIRCNASSLRIENLLLEIDPRFK
jgi:hypothetical protein